MATIDELLGRFRASAAEQASRSPLNSQLSDGIAADPEVAGLLRAAPPEQQLPVLLLAAVHSIVLAEPDLELAAWYPTVCAEPRTDHPYPAFAALCHARRDEIEHLLRTHHTQTNEVGRCALFLPALGLLAAEVGELAVLDVGASAGLNLQLDRYRYVYEPGGVIGDSSPVSLVTGTRGAVPLPAEMPTLVVRRGIDRLPIDLADTEQVRWLRACVWPDQPDRLHRLDAAIAIAVADPPDLREGSALEVASHVAELADHAHPVVLNSWVLNYLSPDEQATYVAELDAVGADLDVSWVYAEAPALCERIPFGGSTAGENRTVLMLTSWRSGRRTVRQLGVAHPHGFWLHWSDGPEQALSHPPPAVRARATATARRPPW